MQRIKRRLIVALALMAAGLARGHVARHQAVNLVYE